VNEGKANMIALKILKRRESFRLNKRHNCLGLTFILFFPQHNMICSKEYIDPVFKNWIQYSRYLRQWARITKDVLHIKDLAITFVTTKCQH